MLDALRKAFSVEHSSSLDTTFVNPGPAYLPINALAVTGITYLISRLETSLSGGEAGIILNSGRLCVF